MTTNIDVKAMQDVIDGSTMKHNDKKKKDETKNTGKIMIYGVPHEWIDAIHKNSMTVSKFAKNAIEEKLKNMDLI